MVITSVVAGLTGCLAEPGVVVICSPVVAPSGVTSGFIVCVTMPHHQRCLRARLVTTGGITATRSHCRPTCIKAGPGVATTVTTAGIAEPGCFTELITARVTSPGVVTDVSVIAGSPSGASK